MRMVVAYELKFDTQIVLINYSFAPSYRFLAQTFLLQKIDKSLKFADSILSLLLISLQFDFKIIMQYQNVRKVF